MAVNIQAASDWHTGYQIWLTVQQSLENAQLVANHLGDTWSPTAISALCGNMRAESSLNPDMYEFGYDWADDMHHIPFGLITQGGKKLSTRKGKIILLEEVLNEATNLAMAQINEKNPSLEDKEEVAKQVGIGAVIFHDLKNDRLNNFDFVLEEVVQFEGETGPYVQYTNARALSILRKAAVELDLDQPLSLSDDYAWDVIKLINSFPVVVMTAFEKFEPSVIAKYALHLSQAFNKYYGNTRILNDDAEKNARLVLVKATTVILQESLRLLGVKAPNKM